MALAFGLKSSNISSRSFFARQRWCLSVSVFASLSLCFSVPASLSLCLSLAGGFVPLLGERLEEVLAERQHRHQHLHQVERLDDPTAEIIHISGFADSGMGMKR